ncbi:MAG: hypothetical protein IPO21_15945 [Bacteroidales bacterium]|nr:hypothetical protein [Bacteroidales bacterium]
MNRLRFLVFVFIQFIIANVVYSQQKQVAGAMDVLSNVENLSKEADEIIKKIDAAVASVENSNAYKTLVDGKSVTFPFGILPDDGDANYALIVNNVKMDAIKGLTVELYMKIPFTQDQNLYFLADAVPLSTDGSISGDFKLFLLKTTSLKVGDGYSLSFNGLGKGSYDSTYVTINCRGFVDVTLNGSVDFNPNTIEKCDDSGSPTGEPYSLKFYVHADKISNFVIELHDIPDFQFKSLPGFRCSIPKIVIDQSDLQNAPAFNLPEWYLEAIKEASDTKISTDIITSPLWTGVYIPEIEIEIPKSFTEGSKQSSLFVNATDFIVDQHGITAFVKTFGTKNSPLIAGDIKGFAFELDSIELNVVKSTIAGSGFDGRIAFPVCDETQKIDFSINIGTDKDGEMTFSGEASFVLPKPLELKALSLASLTLKTNSNLEFKYKNKQFYPKATLNGELTVGVADSAKSKSSIGSLTLEFNQLVIQGEAPYISLGDNVPIDVSTVVGDISETLKNSESLPSTGAYLRLKSGTESSLSGLPVSISSVEMVSKDGGQKLGFGMVLTVHLQQSSGGDSQSSSGFSGKAGFTIWTKRNAVSKKWGYDGFTLNSIVVNVDQEAFKLYGSIERFEEDSMYGTGYCGYIKLDVIDKIKVEVAAIFGKKDDSRYWFVDASAKLPGIPIGPGIELNSFTGGLYHHMTMLKSGEATTVSCKTASGRSYVPAPSIFLGLLAGVGVQSTGGGTAFNGNINFGIEFHNNGGVKQIATWGGVEFMSFNFKVPDVSKVAEAMSSTPLDTTGGKPAIKRPDGPALTADWFVSYNFENDELFGDFNVYVNLLGVVEGSGANKKAGNISLFASPNTWYVYMGKPIEGEMLGVSVLGLMTISSYFCIGDQLPDPPIASMPPEIKPNINIDYSLLQAGSGMSFGSRHQIEGNPGLSLGVCSARAELKYMVKSGFDVLISQSKEPVFCKGQSKARGINDWYATGQAYFYGSAKLGVRYDCWLGDGYLNLLSMYLSASVFVQLPSPTYFTGSVEVGFSCLSMDFRKSFSLEFGDVCESITFDNNVKFIDAFDPGDGFKDVMVNQPIQVYFQNPLEDFVYKIQGQNGTTAQYRSVIRGFDSNPVGKGIIVTCNEKPISVTWKLNKSKDMLTIIPDEVYPEDTLITVIITLETQYRSSENEAWKLADANEIDTVSFRTKKEPLKLEVKDVFYAYPLPNMENFYRNESTQGYIQLAMKPNKPVKLAPDYEFSVAIYSFNEEVDRVRNVTFNGESKFTFAIPTMRLESGKQYTLKLIKSPKQTFTQETYTENVASNSAVGKVDDGRKDIVILEYNFVTSIYDTFKEKMAMYNTSFSEIFNGITAAKLSISAAKSAGVQIENMSENETDGYFVNGSKYANELIKFGNINYSNANIRNLASITDINLKDNGNGAFTTVTNVVDAINSTLKDVNLKCLLNGGCSSLEMSQIRIPKGEFIIPLEYVLPGQTIANSVHNISVNLNNDLVLPQ